MGKTRLAVQVAARLNRRFPDRVWLAELAHLRDEDLLVHAIAHTVGIHDTAGDPLTALIEHLGGRRVLPVLDNCEHLLEACTRLAAVVLRSTGGLHLLATSGESLRVPGGREFRLAPLAADDPAGASHAVELFADRATRGDLDLRRHRRQPGRRGRGVPPPGRHSAGDRAGRGPAPGAVGAAAAGASRRPVLAA